MDGDNKTLEITLGDLYAEKNFDNVKTCYLTSVDGKVSVPVTPDLIPEYPSLIKRTKIVDQVAYVILDANPYQILDLAMVISERSRIAQMGDTLTFIYSLADINLEDEYKRSYNDFLLEITQEQLVSQNQRPPTPELEQLPVNYLLSYGDTLKAALSHPDLFECDNNALGRALASLFENEINVFTWKKKDCIFFTDEFDNLPTLVNAPNRISPYHAKQDPKDPYISVLAPPARRKRNYKQAVSQLKRDIRSSYRKLNALLQKDYIVIVGNKVSIHLFGMEEFGYPDSITICLKNPNYLKEVLEILGGKSVEKISDNNYKVKDECCRYYNVIVHPLGYKHFTISETYCIDRCYFDGKDIYMSVSCMMTLVNGGFMICDPFHIPKSDTVTKLLQYGFKFFDNDLTDVGILYQNLGIDLSLNTLEVDPDYKHWGISGDYHIYQTSIYELLSRK